MKNNIIVGIDLGTTNSVVSILDNKVPKTLPIDNAKLLPSVVSLTDTGFVVGQVAKNLAILEPAKTVSSIKRKMGKDILLAVGEKQMRPEEISAIILRKIKQTVVNLHGLAEKDALRAVITVPAYFTEEQRHATKQAAELAGLQVERIINEPTAAALSFGLATMDEAIYAIYDLGGGTFDVSIIESNEGLIEVLATTGDNNLGGDDFDLSLAAMIWHKFLTTNNLQEREPTAKEQARLLRIAEQTKIKLSTDDEVAIQENFFLKMDGKAHHLEVTITRTEFENLIRPNIDNTVSLLDKAIEEAELDLDELDGIILVGGSSRIPLVATTIEDKLNIVPMLIDLPDEAVSHGATIQGAIIDNVAIDTVLVDITPHSLGIAVVDENLESAFGLFMDGGSPLSTATLIPKNTPIPAKNTQRFGSVTPFQKQYHIQVCQGEHAVYVQNKEIGDMMLEITKPVEQGSIDVNFELDINGLLKVTAYEVTTKEVAKATFQSSRGKKLKKSKEVTKPIVTLDDATKKLIDRAKNVMNSEALNAEDKEELANLVAKYEGAKLAQQGEEATSVETELLDLLYYLEENDN